MNGMVKLIYSSAFDNTVDVCMRILEDPAALTKSAATIFGLDYDDLKPDADHIGIHATAVGAFERYGANRNADSFPKLACVRFHDTFVKHGAIFRHHRNKDRAKSLGIIKASAYNDAMDRIELFIHADKNKAADELTRLEKDGEIPFSMACARAGTIVVTSCGPKTIENIEQGDLVLTHTGQFKPVGNRSVRDVSEYVVVNTVSWGRTGIEITGNHPFQATTFDDLDRGTRKDHVEHPDKGYRRRHRAELHKYLKWIPAADLTQYHYLAVPIDYVESEHVNINWARVLGYYVAEGSLSDGMTCFTCGIDDDAVRELSGLASWTSVTIQPRTNSDKAVVVQCFGTDLRNQVEALCGRRGENKVVPFIIQHAQREAKFNFLATWFNGDGWQDADGLHWSTHYQGLAIDLQRLLASLDIPSGCQCIDHPTNRGLVISEDAVEYVVTVSNQYSDLFVGISKAVELDIEGTTKCRTFISGSYLMVPVKSVIPMTLDEPVPVYNFSVEGDESYTVYGLAVHNCKVAFDRCNRCNTLRKNAQDPNQCDHVKYELGKMADDGTITCTHNDEPDFFDISFVGRPADRIAWNLKVAAGESIDSIKLAEAEGIWVPDYIAIESALGQAKLAHLKKLAAFQSNYVGWFTKQASVQTFNDRYLYELRKAAGVRLDDTTITALRDYEPQHTFSALAQAGVILDIPSFFKYAMGNSFSDIEALIPEVARAVPVVIDTAVKQGDCQKLCNDYTFDVPHDIFGRNRLPAPLMQKLADAAITSRASEERVINVTLDGKVPKFAVDTKERIGFNTPGIVVLAEKYAAYKLSAIEAILGFHKDTDVDSMLAVAAAQNLVV